MTKMISKIVGRKERVNTVNTIMKEISNCGRNFFKYERLTAQLVDRGKIYYKAEYGKKKFICLTLPPYRSPRGWFHGGTLLSLVQEFRDYIKDGHSREYSALKSPHWGYPEKDMESIRTLAVQLGFLTNDKHHGTNI